MKVQFEVGLRTYGEVEKDKLERERKWTTVAKKDRHDFPEFLPKYQDEMTVRKEMKETGKLKKLTYSGNVFAYYLGFDGDANYPPYTMKFK